MGNKVVVEGSPSNYRNNGVAVFGQATACSGRAAHGFSITRVPNMRGYQQAGDEVS